jgi:hypothetical protein
MDFTQTEVNELARTVSEIAEKEVFELAELQLALVGGGIGDVIVG